VTPLVAIEHLSKSFPGVRALNDCRFELMAGEVHALIGEKPPMAKNSWFIFSTSVSGPERMPRWTLHDLRRTARAGRRAARSHLRHGYSQRAGWHTADFQSRRPSAND
jgi:hypothetical protein